MQSCPTERQSASAARSAAAFSSAGMRKVIDVSLFTMRIVRQRAGTLNVRGDHSAAPGSRNGKRRETLVI